MCISICPQRGLRLLIALLFTCVMTQVGSAQVEFNRDIRPILSDACFHCHGPDGAKRQAGLRLDEEVSAKSKRDGKQAVVPGKSASSEVIRRITSHDPDEVMPPPTANRPLSHREIETLKKWIDEGASWQQHWSFIAPKRPDIPNQFVVNAVHPNAAKESSTRLQWFLQPIDHFILKKLTDEGLTHSDEAGRETLIRRITLDLTGLPPTLDELDEFLSDRSPDAFERVIDRLLASPRYGERMVLDWLDAARYADTNGYQGDGTRTMWPWRDWAIRAINSNMPFDQFTIEQIAGDLLPNSTLDQKIATGFHRNHPLNGEGGRIAEESRVEYVFDRVETTGTVWLGLTIGCCRCHDHKYDALTQKEYYQLSAYFNSIAESGAVDRGGNANPVERVASADDEQMLAILRENVARSEKAQKDGEAAIESAQAEWEKNPGQRSEWIVLEPSDFASKNGTVLKKLDDHSLLATESSPTNEDYEITFRLNRGTPSQPFVVSGLRIEAMPDESLPSKGPGRAPENGNFVLTSMSLEVASSKGNGDTKKIGFVRGEADYSQGGFNPGGVIDSDRNSGWAVAGGENSKGRVAMFVLSSPLNLTDEHLLKLTLKHESIHIKHVLGRFRISLTTSKVPQLDLSLPADVASALSTAVDARSTGQKKRIAEYYRDKVSPEYAALKANTDAAKKKLADFENSLGVTMVMRDQPQLRDTFVLIRGAYTSRGEKVAHGVPAVLPALPADAPLNRLALARWLVSSSNPLTARVTVNRAWQSFFGMGLVKTTEDFGTQGEPPSHPQLLDWLAVEFAQSPDGSTSWDVKRLHRMIVSSATYRQSSRMMESLRERDPENRLLARGPRHRLPSFAIRDVALSLSGLLVERLGGPSVKPYQPAGIWEDASLGKISYVPDKGAGLYRRSLYTFWRRIAAPSMFFDASSRNVCTVKLPRTNTPLQALSLMNDVQYVEAARMLAERTLKSGGSNDDARMDFAFRLATSRHPKAGERALMLDALRDIKEKFQQSPELAKRLISTGDSSRDETLSEIELASYTAIMNLILNLDETISKE